MTISTAIIPMLSVHDGGAALAFYKRGFGATVVAEHAGPDGKLVAELAIDGATFSRVEACCQNDRAIHSSLSAI